MKVLIADDDVVTQLLLQDILSRWGYETLVAADGLQAMQLVGDNPDLQLFIVDWSMPWLDGLELCKRLKSGNRFIYFMMISSRNGMEHMVHAMEQGVDDFVAKPFAAEEIIARLKVGQRIIEQERKLSFYAQNDALTGIWNRRMVMALFESEWSRAQRDGSSLGLMFLDLDHFKKINDNEGHLVGDDVLKHFCATVKQQLRAYDHMGRYGGEEFVLLLPHTSLLDANMVAERVRTAVAQQPARLASGNKLYYSVSIGVTTSQSGDKEINDMIRRADAGTYRAKALGRNRVISLPDPYEEYSASA